MDGVAFDLDGIYYYIYFMLMLNSSCNGNAMTTKQTVYIEGKHMLKLGIVIYPGHPKT